MASASGLEKVPLALRNPLHTTTEGTGQLIQHAFDEGHSHIIVGMVRVVCVVCVVCGSLQVLTGRAGVPRTTAALAVCTRSAFGSGFNLTTR